MAIERITFPGPGGTELSARLDMPEGPHLATALFAHCFTCGKDIPAARRIAGRLAAMGIAVLRFDFTGLHWAGRQCLKPPHNCPMSAPSPRSARRSIPPM